MPLYVPLAILTMMLALAAMAAFGPAADYGLAIIIAVFGALVALAVSSDT